MTVMENGFLCLADWSGAHGSTREAQTSAMTGKPLAEEENTTDTGRKITKGSLGITSEPGQRRNYIISTHILWSSTRNSYIHKLKDFRATSL